MKVVICLDLSSYTQRVLDTAKMLLATRVPQPEIIVLHIVDTNFAAGEPDEDAVIRDLKEESSRIYQMAKITLSQDFIYREEYGAVQRALDDALDTVPHDLLIVGTRGRSLTAGVLLGSISSHLLHHIKSPLLVVP